MFYYVFNLSLESLLVFMDDFVIYRSGEDQLEKVCLAFKQLNECKMQLSPYKCRIRERSDDPWPWWCPKKEFIWIGRRSRQFKRWFHQKTPRLWRSPYKKFGTLKGSFICWLNYPYSFQIIRRTNNFMWTITTDSSLQCPYSYVTQ